MERRTRRDWYFDNLDRDGTERMLEKYGDKHGISVFLVRPSTSQPNCYVLSRFRRNPRDFGHELISFVNHKYCMLESKDRNMYNSLDELVSRTPEISGYFPIGQLIQQDPPPLPSATPSIAPGRTPSPSSYPPSTARPPGRVPTRSAPLNTSSPLYNNSTQPASSFPPSVKSVSPPPTTNLRVGPPPTTAPNDRVANQNAITQAALRMSSRTTNPPAPPPTPPSTSPTPKSTTPPLPLSSTPPRTTVLSGTRTLPQPPPLSTSPSGPSTTPSRTSTAPTPTRINRTPPPPPQGTNRGPPPPPISRPVPTPPRQQFNAPNNDTFTPNSFEDETEPTTPSIGTPYESSSSLRSEEPSTYSPNASARYESSSSQRSEAPLAYSPTNTTDSMNMNNYTNYRVASEQFNNNKGGVLREGWMEKKGHTRRNYKVRWFVLTSNALSYFVKPGPSEKPKGVIDLSNADNVEIIELKNAEFKSKERPFCFKITVKSEKKEYIIDARSGAELQRWLQAVRQALQK